jgi:hypothetical protein
MSMSTCNLWTTVCKSQNSVKKVDLVANVCKSTCAAVNLMIKNMYANRKHQRSTINTTTSTKETLRGTLNKVQQKKTIVEMGPELERLKLIVEWTLSKVR